MKTRLKIRKKIYLRVTKSCHRLCPVYSILIILYFRTASVTQFRSEGEESVEVHH